MLISKPVRPSLHQLTYFLQRHGAFHGRDPRIVAGLAGAAAVAAAGAWLLLRSKRPTAEELEHRRREHLSNFGRITDGVILDTRTLRGEESYAPPPEVLVYSYRHAGVTYECAQDVSGFPERVTDCRLDQTVQVRYDPRNPGNSLLVSEDWTGLWLPGQRRG